MTLEQLDAVATVLCGTPRWQVELSRFVNVTPRAVRFWVAGDHKLPADLVDRLDEAFAKRIAELTEAKRGLRSLKSNN